MYFETCVSSCYAEVNSIYVQTYMVLVEKRKTKQFVNFIGCIRLLIYDNGIEGNFKFKPFHLKIIYVIVPSLKV